RSVFLFRRMVDVGAALGEEGIVALAQEAGVRPRIANVGTPAQVTRHVHVRWELTRILVEVFANGAHAGRVGIAGRGDVVEGGLVPGVAGQGVVTAGLVIDRAHQGGPVHPPRQTRQVFADLDARHA